MPSAIDPEPGKGTPTGPVRVRARRAPGAPRAPVSQPRAALLRCWLVAAAALPLAGCSAVPYYSQAISGEIALLAAARPVEDWIADPATPAELRQRLELAVRIRRFASQDLALPDNRSYTRYADLHRSSAVWNVFATPELSLELQTWCYPVFGCAAYRGYFAQADAQQLATELRAQGSDAAVTPVPAFSTLGWLSDPLLSTFLRWPEPELARLIFHELAHQVVYVRDDTRFNESFASAVERAGLARWVAQRDDPALREQYRQYEMHHQGLLALVGQARAQLQALYGSGQPEARRRSGKQAIFEDLGARYRVVRDTQWGGYAGYDAFFQAPWNNARVAALAAYQDDVPAFEALLAQEQGQMPRFFDAVRRLAALPAAQRASALQALAPVPGSGA